MPQTTQQELWAGQLEDKMVHGVPKADAYTKKKMITDLTYMGHLALLDRDVHSKEPTLCIMV